MLKFIQVENFKSLKKVNMSLGNLNLFFGCNGMGKSSVIQSLLLLCQSYWKDKAMTSLYTNGELVRLGTSKDIFCQLAEDNFLRFYLKGDNGCFDVRYNYEDAFSDKLRGIVEQNSAVDSLFKKKFIYLGAEHIGPQNSYSSVNWDGKNLGQYGEYTVPYLARYGEQIKINKDLCLEGARSDFLIDQATAWMKKVSPGVRLNATEELVKQEAYLHISYDMQKLAMERISPVNTGYGISYVLPIIVALLAAGDDDMLLIENPESHLHPKGQTAMAELMALVAAHGTQIICESHSDHIINGVRVAVKKSKLNNEDLVVAYFDKDDNQITHVDVIDVDSKGNLKNYPKGLLDEWGNAMTELLLG